MESTQQSPAFPGDQETTSIREGRYSETLNRSCEPCRARKIRCQIEQSRRCARCEKFGLACIFLPPTTKKRRRRTDARVTELENELRRLKDRLDGADDPESPPPASDSMDDAPPQDCEESPGGRQNGGSTRINSSRSPPRLDMALGELNGVTVEQLLQKFVADLAPHLPFIDCTELLRDGGSNTRQNRPALFHAVIAASAASAYPPMGRSLASKLDELYADQIFIRGEKSLDLVQALLLTATHYYPPDQFRQLKFTQYAHMAANMALDVRLGTKRRIEKGRGRAEASSLDSARTLVACYNLCSRFDAGAFDK